MDPLEVEEASPEAQLSSEALVERHRALPRVDYAEMRQEADEFFGTENRVDQHDPWKRVRS